MTTALWILVGMTYLHIGFAQFQSISRSTGGNYPMKFYWRAIFMWPVDIFWAGIWGTYKFGWNDSRYGSSADAEAEKLMQAIKDKFQHTDDPSNN